MNSTTGVRTAVIMARGLGTRMSKADADAALTADQSRMADRGIKGMIDVGRPFLDHVISACADAGLTEIVLVIGPEHDAIGQYYDQVAKERVTIRYAIQQQPRGTGDAVRSALDLVGHEPYVVLNSDNHYPAEVLAQLCAVDGCGLVGFDPEGLVRHSNIAAERVRSFALLEVADGHLVELVEKPDEATVRRMAGAPVSMNCWLFTAAMRPYLEALQPSPRGELELPDAVRAAVADGVPFTVVPSDAGVLDLSSRADVAAVAAELQGREVRL